MSKRHFSVLLALTLLAAVAVALLAPQKVGRQSESGSDLLLPLAGSRINDVSEVRIRTADSPTVTLRRVDERWQVEELQGYPVDWSRLRQLLADLAQAKVVEQKTDNPDYYARLGVEDLEQEGASGVLLELGFEGESVSLMVGKDAGSRKGQYVRLTGSPRSVLVDRELEVAREPIDWAERNIIDVLSADVAEVEIIHPDGDWIRARKISAGETDFTLESLPTGREVTSSWTVNSLAGALSDLRMDAVEVAGETLPEQAVRFRILTFPGVEYMVQAWQVGDDHWVALQASLPFDKMVENPSEASEPGPSSTQAMEAMRAEIAAFNQLASGWWFRIPEYKFTALTKRGEQLLKPLEETAPENG